MLLKKSETFANTEAFDVVLSYAEKNLFFQSSFIHKSCVNKLLKTMGKIRCFVTLSPPKVRRFYFLQNLFFKVFWEIINLTLHGVIRQTSLINFWISSSSPLLAAINKHGLTSLPNNEPFLLWQWAMRAHKMLQSLWMSPHEKLKLSIFSHFTWWSLSVKNSLGWSSNAEWFVIKCHSRIPGLKASLLRTAPQTTHWERWIPFFSVKWNQTLCILNNLPFLCQRHFCKWKNYTPYSDAVSKVTIQSSKSVLLLYTQTCALTYFTLYKLWGYDLSVYYKDTHRTPRQITKGTTFFYITAATHTIIQKCWWKYK